MHREVFTVHVIRTKSWNHKLPISVAQANFIVLNIAILHYGIRIVNDQKSVVKNATIG